MNGPGFAPYKLMLPIRICPTTIEVVSQSRVRLLQPNDVRRVSLRCLKRTSPAQQAWRDVPLAAVIGDDRHRFPIVSCEYAFNQGVTIALEANAVTDAEF